MIEITTKTTVRIETPLCVKELAAALGRELGRNTHPSFIYAARASGFPMRWSSRLRCEVATLSELLRWLDKTGFRKR